MALDKGDTLTERYLMALNIEQTLLAVGQKALGMPNESDVNAFLSPLLRGDHKGYIVPLP